MANNAIALQIRAPRGVDMGSVIQQNAMAINQVAQQQAAQRQAAKDQQAMELARTKETREAATAKADLLSKAAGLLRDGFVNYAKFGDEPAIQATRQFVIDMFPTLNLDKVIPPAHVLATDENRYNQAYMTAEQWANKNFGNATTSTVIDPTTNEVKVVNASGLPGKSFSATIPDISRDIRPTPNPTAPAAGAAAPPPAAALSDDQLNAAAQAVVRGANISDPALRNVPQEQFGEVQRRAQQMGAQSEPPAELRPMSYSPEGQQPDLGKIVQTMMDTGVVSQSDVDAMRQAAGPGKDAQLAELLRANNIRIMPNEGMPGARNAVYNPDEGTASMQESDYAPSAYPATYGKPPMQSPMPGSAQVPLPRVRGEAAAGEAGKQGVRVATEPKIAAGTKEAERLVALRGKMPEAWSALAARFADMGRRVADIDYILARPQALEGITGPLEGRLTEYANVIRPGGERYQDVQSRINKVKAAQVVQELRSMRESSPQGSSLFGQVTEFEDRLVQAMAGLDQAQSRPAFESALRSLRSVYNEMGTQLPDAFNKTFAEVMEPAQRLKRFGYPMPGARKGPMRYNPATGDFE